MSKTQFKSYGRFEKKALSTDDKGLGVLKISGWASKSYENGKPIVDRDSEHVDTKGFDLTNAKILLYNHIWTEPIGKCTLTHKAEGIWLEGEIHEAMDSRAFYAAKEGIMDSFSIGFSVDEYQFVKVDGEDIVSFTKGSVIECSLVSIPANTKATISSTEVIKSMIKDGKVTGFQCSVKDLKAMNPDSSIVDFINGNTEETRVTEITTEEANNAALAYVKEYWNLCPEKASTDPQANPEVWQHMASVWNITEAEARRRLCANCEYYDNTPEAMKEMDAIPQNEYDKDGGGRGYCHKFDFICHNLRTCQAWEEKEYYNPDEEEKSLKKDIKNIIKGLTFEDTQKERWTQKRLLDYFIGVLTTTIEDNFYESMWQDGMSPEDYKQNILDALSAFGEKLNELPVLDIQVPDTVQKEIKREFMTKEMENNTPEAQVEGTPPAEGTEILEGENTDTPEPVVEPTAEQDAQDITTNSEVVEPVSEDVDAPIEQSVSKPTVQSIIGTLATVNLNDLTVEEIEAMYNTSSDLLEKIEAYVKADIEGDE